MVVLPLICPVVFLSSFVFLRLPSPDLPLSSRGWTCNVQPVPESTRFLPSPLIAKKFQIERCGETPPSTINRDRSRLQPLPLWTSYRISSSSSHPAGRVTPSLASVAPAASIRRLLTGHISSLR